MSEAIKLTEFSKGGGCGCKIAPAVLQQIVQTSENSAFAGLLVGNESADDAAVYDFNGETAIISTADFFVPIVDDPFDFGRIAAANAISDVYAMGGTPMMAIAILGWPIDKLPVEVAQKVLEGGRAVCREAAIPLAGGHTIDSQDPIFGLSVTGSAKAKHIKRNNTARPGDAVFLTKPLGSGILSTALKRGLLQEGHYPLLLQQLTQLNSIGADLGAVAGVHAMTDVTGFGLLGHLIEMAEGSALSIQLHYNSIQKMEGVEAYLQQRAIPDATYRNWNSYSKKVQFEKGINVMEAFSLLPDPQTNGGLLIAVAEEAAEAVQQLIRQRGFGHFLQRVGTCVEKGDKTIVVTA